jgi:hypothetical protein
MNEDELQILDYRVDGMYVGEMQAKVTRMDL